MKAFCENSSLFVAAVLAGLVFVCSSSLESASGQSLKFVDVSASAGVSVASGASGVAVADFDRNGTSDLFFAAADGASSLLSGNGDGSFRDVTSETGLDVSGSFVDPVWADVNNDGFPDLFLGARHPGTANRLFINGGDGTFADRLPESGIDPNASVGSAAFGDFDSDGLVDLYIATQTGPDQLYRNVDGSTFSDVTSRYGVEGLDGSIGMQTSWFDFDADGDLDLFVVHDGTFPNRLHENHGGLYFQEVAATVGVADVGSGNGMGLTWFDADLDGRIDLYVTRIFEASLYHNLGSKRFEDRAAPFGLLQNGMSWGVVSEDFDNDSDPDLFIVNTFSYDKDSETFLYENEGGVFTNVAASADADVRMDAFGVAAADFNGDGLVDVAIASAVGDNRILLNQSIDAGHWISIELTGTDANRMAIGATVRLTANGVTRQNTVFAGDSYCSQSSSTLHMGTGVADVVDVLEILWPGDREAERFENLSVDRAYKITEGLGIAVDNETEKPTSIELNLESPFPNPFDRMTTLHVTVPSPARTAVTVIDILGRTIADLDKREAAPGTFSVHWDGSLPTGTSAAPGVYFVKLDVEGRTLVRRVVKKR